MTKEYTIEVDVDGEPTEVTLSQPQGIEFMHIVATMPDSFSEMGPEIDLDSDDVDWLQALLEVTTDLSRREIQSGISVEDLNKLIGASAEVFAGEEPSTPSDSFRIERSEGPFEAFELDSDGSVDTDEWR